MKLSRKKGEERQYRLALLADQDYWLATLEQVLGDKNETDKTKALTGLEVSVENWSI